MCNCSADDTCKVHKVKCSSVGKTNCWFKGSSFAMVTYKHEPNTGVSAGPAEPEN